MNIISYGVGEKQVDGAEPFIGRVPGSTKFVTFWHRDYATTSQLLGRCATIGVKALVQCEDWATNHAPDWARTGNFIKDHASHPAFGGFYWDEPGIRKPSSGDYATHLSRYKSLLAYIHARTAKSTIAVFGLHTELTAGYSGLARVEGVDNYWADPVPASRDWGEFTGFADALVAGHRRTGWQGDYVSVVAAYARPAAGWVSSANEMARTHDYMRGLVGARLTWTMLWAAETNDPARPGYISSAEALAEVQRYTRALELPPPPPVATDVVVKLKAGQRLIVERD